MPRASALKRSTVWARSPQMRSDGWGGEQPGRQRGRAQNIEPCPAVIEKARRLDQRSLRRSTIFGGPTWPAAQRLTASNGRSRRGPTCSERVNGASAARRRGAGCSASASDVDHGSWGVERRRARPHDPLSSPHSGGLPWLRRQRLNSHRVRPGHQLERCVEHERVRRIPPAQREVTRRQLDQLTIGEVGEAATVLLRDHVVWIETGDRLVLVDESRRGHAATERGQARLRSRGNRSPGPVRQGRSKGRRHAKGAMSWWIALGPHDPGA